MKTKSVAIVGVMAAVLGSAGVARATDIDFELGAQNNFINTVALSNEYAGQGVVFSGPATGSGGAVLSVFGGFGVTPRSGMDFLAFNSGAILLNGGTPTGPETMVFSSPQTSVRIYVSGGFDTNTMRYAAAWTGGFLDLSRTHMVQPKGTACAFIGGPLQWGTRNAPGWAHNGSFEELRVCLYFEQRRSHHMGEIPTGIEADRIRALFGTLRTSGAAPS